MNMVQTWKNGSPSHSDARSTKQESLGFSPAELVFGQDISGFLKMIKEHWMNAENEGTEVQRRIGRLKTIW